MPLRFAAGLVMVLLLASSANAAQRRETLIYSQFDVDPGEWRYFPFPAKAANARLDVRFEVVSPNNSTGVRVLVLTEADLAHYNSRQPHGVVQASDYRRDATVRTRLPQSGGYAVVIENRKEARRRCRVDLEVTLTTGPDPETLPVSYVSPGKRLIVVSVSIAGFLIILAVAGQALLRAMRRSH